MRLDDYLHQERLSLTVFARRIGRAISTVSKIRRGVQRPDWSTMDAIRDATGGKVTANDFHAEPPRTGKAA